MAKVLISTIGRGGKQNGTYGLAEYEYEENRLKTPFISKALVEFLDIDKLFLVGTSGSIWESAYMEFGGNDEDVMLQLYQKQEEYKVTQEDLKEVEEAISNHLGCEGSKCFLISNGTNETELWNNFSIYLKILEHIEEGDEVHIDITHAFRSLALMSFLMLQLGETVYEKRFNIQGIYYGMFELKSETGRVPVINLSMLYEIIEWMKAIENLTKYGNADKIVELIGAEALKEERNLFKNFSTAVRMANMAAIQENVKRLSKKIDIIQNSSNPVIKLLTKEVADFIKRLDKNRTSDFQLALAEWFCEHKHYALGYIALVESIVSKICEVRGYNINDYKMREQAKKEISKVSKNLFFQVYKTARDIRNDIAHQSGERKNSLICDAINLSKLIEQTKKYFHEIDSDRR